MPKCRNKQHGKHKKKKSRDDKEKVSDNLYYHVEISFYSVVNNIRYQDGDHQDENLMIILLFQHQWLQLFGFQQQLFIIGNKHAGTLSKIIAKGCFVF
jgi:hypothetical protein